jgi:hypothetical protein
MSEEQVFNAKGECPKCGTNVDGEVRVISEQVYDHSTKRWSESKRMIEANISTTFVKLPPGAKCLCGKEDSGEHLHRKCLVCGFYWSETTLQQHMESN